MQFSRLIVNRAGKMRIANLRIIPVHLSRYTRLYSTQPQNIRSFNVYIDQNEQSRSNILLGPSKEYPLPGQVTCNALNVENRIQKRVTRKPPVTFYTLNPKQLANLLTTSAIRDESYKPDPVVKEVCTWNLKIELVALECPILLKNELMRLFPEAKLRDRRITLINFHEAVEENSDSDRAVDVTEKADSFILAAGSVCATLRGYGFWADFVDPVSGASRLNKNSYRRLLKQNSNYERIGVSVEEEANCKVVSHISLNETPFIGTIFTNAPLNSKAIEQIINSGSD